MHKRYLSQPVLEDLERKMVFIGGPRQVGKTVFSTRLMASRNTGYLNWDIDEDRTRILKKQFPATKLLVLDEVHKYRKWRNYLKGIYDAMAVNAIPRRQLLVTGSAKLDYYRFGGGSLQGRYHYLRLLPLSLAEIKGVGSNDLDRLFKYSGFPEPFFGGSEKQAKRWSAEYSRRTEFLGASNRFSNDGATI